MEYQNKLVRVEKNGNGVVLVTLDNPPVNTISLGVTAELNETLRRLDKDGDARALVLAGSGSKAFCAGSDIKEFPGFGENVLDLKMKKENETYDLIEKITKPVVCALEGIVFGGGCELALCCDILVAGETAKFAMPEITLGILPGTGGVFRLPRAVGINKALEMMYLGEPIDAHEALRWGLVNKVVPAGTALEAASALAARIADKPSLALATIKRYAREMYSRRRDEIFWMNLEMFEPVFNSDECREGYSAFIEKRQPKFHS